MPEPRKSGGPKGQGPEGFGARRVGARRGGGRRVGGPNFRAFFFSLPLEISFFLLSLGGLLMEFWWCLKRRHAQMCAFGVLWLFCEAPAARSGGAAGVSHHSPRARKTGTSLGSGFQTPPKFNEQTPRETEKERNGGGREEGKKRAKFWAVRRRPVRRRGRRHPQKIKTPPKS